ncbi:uncharacterized protein Tco025E_00059 [Trypanosoma conorhini]|uniref:Uncharacterized protein n=1 Tax=Trypanosoma conorhini TaxID=83891 RepID=A0A422QCM1_9TRYP|nr:uncharacterized protein Tco025E_00059 [Trypanosoma conorhini]RNF27675.1 hypothetical protein Tco025E_00059 [Trypanosoma conorhini]
MHGPQVKEQLTDKRGVGVKVQVTGKWFNQRHASLMHGDDAATIRLKRNECRVQLRNILDNINVLRAATIVQVILERLVKPGIGLLEALTRLLKGLNRRERLRWRNINRKINPPFFKPVW